MSAPVLYESHCHTPLCKHATGEPEEYAAAAEKRGLKGVIVTCHCPLPDGFSGDVRMTPNEFETYVEMVSRAREALGMLREVGYGEVSFFLDRKRQAVPIETALASRH